jgi:flagellar basal-body rod modification protein FlgD
MNGIGINAAAERVASSLSRTSTTSSPAAHGLVFARSQQPLATTASKGVMEAKSASTSDAASTTAGQVSANDFLTLLVTEMKNQDPTQPTDPNAYIQQLVSVNSLQQLIAINHDLTPPPKPTGNGA